MGRHFALMNSFSKSERLCQKSLFDDLIGSGVSFIKYPFRVVAKESAIPGEEKARIAISVSKRRFKRAVKRNKVKRLLREAFRLNKQTLYAHIKAGVTWDILFIYLDEDIPHYSRIEKSVISSLNKISDIAHTDE